MKFSLLTMSNFSKVQELVKRAKTSYPVPPEALIRNYFLDDDEALHKVFGIFDDNGVLHAFAFVQFSYYDKSYIISYVQKQDFSTTADVVLLLEYVVRYAEENAYFRFSSMSFGKKYTLWERLLSKSYTLSRYIGCTEEIIPKDTKSSLYRYWNFVQRKIIYPYEIYIREYILPDTYRIFQR